jgi:hypothetical protein
MHDRPDLLRPAGRVATPRQCAACASAAGSSSEAVRHAHLTDAARRDLVVVAARIDSPRPEPQAARPLGPERALALADARPDGVLLVAELSDIGTSFTRVLGFVEEPATRGAALASIREAFGPTSCADLVDLEAWHSETFRGRTGDGRRAAQSRCAAVGAAPYGLGRTENGSAAVPEEIAAPCRTLELHTQIASGPASTTRWRRRGGCRAAAGRGSATCRRGRRATRAHVPECGTSLRREGWSARPRSGFGVPRPGGPFATETVQARPT